MAQFARPQPIDGRRSDTPLRRACLRRLVIPFCLALLMAPIPAALGHAADTTAAVVTDFGDKMLRMLNDPSLSRAQRQERFGALLDRDFDLPRISRFVLGRYWRSTSDQQKQAFAHAFRDYLVVSYSARFGDFTGASFAIKDERREGPDSTVVATTVQQRGNPAPARVDWRVSTGSGSPKIADVVVDGVSMSLTYRQEFASVIERGSDGVAGLIARLQAKAGTVAQ